MQKYKTIMLDLESYAKLSNAKDELSKRTGRSISFNEFILELVSKRLEFLEADDSLRQFLAKLSSRLGSIGCVEGVLLFGSVAKGSYRGDSDIDILVLTKDGSGYREIMGALKGMRSDVEALSEKGLPHLVCPVVLGIDDTKQFKPIYLDMSDHGIILYERGAVLTNFLRSISGIRHRRTLVDGVEVLTWQ